MAAAVAAFVVLGGTSSACGGYTANASTPEPTAAPAHHPPSTVAPRLDPPRQTVTAIRNSGLPPLPPMGRLVPPGATTHAAARAPAGARRGVAVFGDSLVLQSWAYVQRIAHDRGQPFDGGSYGGTALCDWLPGIHKVLTKERPATLVLAFAGNNLTPCTLSSSGQRQYGAALVARYRQGEEQAIAEARRVHTTVYLVGPASMRDHVWNVDAAGLRNMLRALVRQHPGVVYLDAHAALSPNGFRYARPCLAFETAALGCHDGTIVVRANDGVHLSPPIGGDGGYSAGGWRFASLLMRGVPDAA